MSLNKRMLLYITFVLVSIFAIFFLPQKAAVFLNNRATELYNQDCMERAENLYDLSLKIYPTAAVYYNRAVLYDNLDRIDDAVDSYKKAVALDPKHVNALSSLVSLYKYQKEFELAREYKQKLDMIVNSGEAPRAGDIDTEQAITKYNDACRRYEEKDYAKALRLMQQAVALKPDMGQAYAGLGNIYYELNELARAFTAYQRALDLGENSAGIYHNIGLIYMQFEDYAAALHYVSLALKADPKNQDIMYTRGCVLRDKGKNEESLEVLTRLRRERPDYPNIHNDIGDLYLILGNKDKAEHEFLNAKNIALRKLEAGDSDPWVKLRLAIAFSGLGDNAKALDYADQAIREAPEFHHAYRIRARIYEKQGMVNEALADINNARMLVRAVYPSQLRKDEDVSGRDKNKSSKRIDFFDTEITLKNGQTITGWLKDKTEDSVVIEVDMGSTTGEVTFSTSKIEQIKRLNK